jgi:hypothetical protein
MRNVIFTLLFIGVTAFSVIAQEETLLSGEIESGGYGGPTLKIGSIHGKSSIFMGGQGGWIINHRFVLGGAGGGLVNNVRVEREGIEKEQYLNFGYGGVLLEYIANSHKLLHYEIQSIIGAGNVSFRDEKNRENQDNLEEDSFFVWEPGANIILNVTKSFRISVGGTYRFVSGVALLGTSEEDLTDYTIQIGFKFGKF